MQPRRFTGLVTASALLFIPPMLGGCSSLLPKSSNDTPGFASFDEARAAVESLLPMHSNEASLKAMGVDPVKYPNITLLTYSDIVHRFVNGSILSKQDLDPGVVACLDARDKCRGLDVAASRIAKVRYGNFFADFFNFSRKTDTSGWRFNALILLVDNVVVYRTWGGQPVVKENEIRDNPLGPLQDIGPSTAASSVTGK